VLVRGIGAVLQIGGKLEDVAVVLAHVFVTPIIDGIDSQLVVK
jgi:hypothetical protein